MASRNLDGLTPKKAAKPLQTPPIIPFGSRRSIRPSLSILIFIAYLLSHNRSSRIRSIISNSWGVRAAGITIHKII